MPNLREIVDGTTICAAAPKAKNPSPVAQHVANHVQDPMGATKDTFEELQQAKLQYDQAREKAQRNLAPVQSVISHVSQMHGIQPGMATPGLDQGGGQNPDDPNQYDEQGNPLNMGQQPGQMNSNRPSLAGHQPGVAPGPQESVRPQKLGMAQPGKPAAQNSPQPGMFNKPAAKPKGNKSLPGAGGPGGKKVVNKNKKAQDNSARQVKVHISGV